MTKSSIPINGKKLADRWGISPTDLMYIIFNHKLNVLHPYDGVMSLNETLERFYKDKDISKYVFRHADVTEIEAKLGVDGKIPLAELIRCNDLMARWEMHDDEISMIMSDKGLEAIDSFGHEIGNDFLFFLIESGTLDVSDLLFRLSDIEDYESKYPEAIPEQEDNKKPKKKKRPSQIHKEKCREVAQSLWEEDPTITIKEISEMNEIMEVTKRTDGKCYSKKTIRNWIKELCPDRTPGRRPKKK